MKVNGGKGIEWLRNNESGERIGPKGKGKVR